MAVDPRDPSRVPTPTLTRKICTMGSRGAMVLINATTRATAPVSDINVIWKMDVAVTRETGKDATNPDKLAIRTTGIGVLNHNHATRAVVIHPSNPATSAAVRRRVNNRNIRMRGNSAINRGTMDMD